MKQQSEWRSFFQRGDHMGLALSTRRSENSDGHSVRVLPDDQLLLFGGAAGAARQPKRTGQAKDKVVHSVVVAPSQDQTEASFQHMVTDLKQEYPYAEFSGFSPENKSQSVGLLDNLVVKLGEVSRQFHPEPDWRDRIPSQFSGDLTFVLSYSPEVTHEALEQAARLATQAESLSTLVPLPLGAGDRIPLPGLTTSGGLDMMVICALRFLLPKSVRVRASWAALGWKVAQIATLYGADELAGWTAAETLAYGGRVRAASRVESAELRNGLQEVGCSWTDWKMLQTQEVP